MIEAGSDRSDNVREEEAAGSDRSDNVREEEAPAHVFYEPTLLLARMRIGAPNTQALLAVRVARVAPNPREVGRIGAVPAGSGGGGRDWSAAGGVHHCILHGCTRSKQRQGQPKRDDLCIAPQRELVANEIKRDRDVGGERQPGPTPHLEPIADPVLT